MINIIIFYLISIIILVNHIWSFKIMTSLKPKLGFLSFLMIIIIPFGTYLLSDYVSIKAIFSFLFLLLLDILVFDETLFYRFYYCFVIWFLFMFFDILEMLLFNFINKELLYNNIIIYCASIFLQVICNLTCRIKIIKRFVKKFYEFLSFYYFYLFCIFIVFVCYWGISCFNDGNISNNIWILFILLLFSCIIIFLIIKIRYLYKRQNFLLSNFSYNNSYYLNTINEMRVFKHNLKNKLAAILTVNSEDKKILVADLLSEVDIIKLSKIEYDGLPTGINGFIQNKLLLVKNDAIVNIVNNISVDLISSISISNYNNLCVALGIVLDNAIESLNKSDDKLLDLLLYNDSDKIYFIVQNTFNGFIDFSSIGNINYSTKGKHRGIGLFYILSDCKINTKVSIHNNIFKVCISLSISKKQTN